MAFNTKKILCVAGTRPKAIRIVPIILALKNEPWAEVRALARADDDQAARLIAKKLREDLA